MKKSLLINFASFLIAVVVLSISCYAWFTKRTEVIGIDAGTKGLMFEYEIGESQELKFTVDNLAFFDFDTSIEGFGIEAREFPYFESMACKVSFTLTNTGTYDFTYRLQNQNSSSSIPYVEFLSFPVGEEISQYQNYTELYEASITSKTNNLLEAGKSQTMDFYIFGVVPNVPSNNDFLQETYILSMEILVTEKK